MGHINDIVTNSQRIKTNITNSFEALKAKGIEISGQETSDDLPSLVESAYEESKKSIPTNGLSWSEAIIVNDTEISNIIDIVYGNNRWVALAEYDTSIKILYSTDGKNWTSSSSFPTGCSNMYNEYNQLQYLGNMFILYTDIDGQMGYYKSTNGEEWVHIEWLDIPYEIGDDVYPIMYYANGVWVLGCTDYSTLVYSTDLETIYNIEQKIQENEAIESIVSINSFSCAGGIFYINAKCYDSTGTSMDNLLFYSRNCIDWSLVSLTDVDITDGFLDRDYFYPRYSITYFEEGIWLALDNYDSLAQICYSDNGIRWFVDTGAFFGLLGSEYYQGETDFKFVSTSNAIYATCNNGLNWLGITNNRKGYSDDGIFKNTIHIFDMISDANFIGVIDNNLYLDDGNYIYIFDSIDGSGSANSIKSLCTTDLPISHNAGIDRCCGVSIIGSDSDGFLYSLDGIQWNKCDKSASGLSKITCIKNANGIWVASDESGKLYYSMTWEDN